MTKNLKNLLGLIVAVLALSSLVMAAPKGHGGGPHGGGSGFREGGGGGGSRAGGGFDGGGAARSAFEHSPSFNVPHSNFNVPHGNPNSFNRSLNVPGVHPYSGHPYSGGPGHPGGPMNFHHTVYGNWYHGDWHDHWVRPWHYGPMAWWSVGFATGVVVWDAPWYWGYWPYYNPYCTEVIVVENATIDYSRPIVVAAPPPAGQPADENQAVQLLDAARQAFARGDYQTAMTLTNQAVSIRPNDALLHEFRGLVLFATKQYKPAAAAIYAVLSIGPGWDWATLISLYPNPEVYTGQLRSLEQYRKENPNLAEVRFLLAYHYMSCGHADAAATELKEVVRLNPKDQLSVQLLAGLLGEKSGTAPAPSPPAAPSLPVDAASLVGNWEATRSDGASLALNLTNSATYSWKYTQSGKSQEFSGAYTVADNLLILKQNGNPTMVGQVTVLDGNRFNFKLVGNNPSDPGLTFSKK